MAGVRPVTAVIVVAVTLALAVRPPALAAGSAAIAVAASSLGWAAVLAVLEAARLGPSHTAWSITLDALDAPTIVTIAGLILTCGMSVRFAVMVRPIAVTRSRQPAFGAAAWMEMEAARRLFPATGTVVVGEAYRPDLDRSASGAFDPKVRATWGQGGRAPVLGFNLDFDSTHMMFFAGSGGYKTTSTVVPTALRYPGSMVVLDPAGEVGPLVITSRQARGRKVICLDPSCDVLQGFNPLAALLRSGRPEEDCIAFARLFITEAKGGKGGGSAEYFQSQSMNMLAGLLYLIVAGPDSTSTRSLAALREMIARPAKDVERALAAAVADPATPRFVRENLGPFVGMAEQTFSGVLSSVAKDTAWLSLPAYAAIVGGDDFDLTELAQGHLDIFVQIPGDTLRAFPGIGRVIIGSLMKAMVQADGHHANRVLFVLDEVDLLGYMSILEEARDRGRKYGITLMLMYQSLGQVEGHFGKEGAASWLEGCSFVSFAAIKSMDTAEAISQRCGDMTVEVAGSSSQSAPVFSKRDATAGQSLSAQGRRLILAHEVVQTMRADEQIVMVRGFPPLRCGRAIYFRRPEMVMAAGANRFARAAGST
jgi:type IV secretion system protein VirD4